MSGSQPGVRGKITSLQLLLKSIKANFINIHGQIRHHVRMCHAKDTGTHTQGYSRSRSQLKVESQAV